MSSSTSPRPFIAVCLAVAFGVGIQTADAQRTCDPAVIDSVISNSPLCPGDHINLAVVATGDILGYSWEGPGTGTFFTFEPQYSFSFQILGDYTVIVYGECGNDTAVVAMTAQGAGAGQSDTLHLCDDGSPIDLSLSLGTHAEGGFWTLDGQPHGNVYDPAVDEPGAYIYTVPFPVTCPGATQSAIITVEETNVGPNTTWSLCATDTAFDLLYALSSDADPDGGWCRMQFLSLIPHTGIYDPAVDSSGIFQYAINGCFATVQVTEWPATAWFADADDDGLGDPLTETWACVQPPGFVADSADLCSDLPGTVGTPCDDGDALTVDDAITDSCICAGDLHTALIELPTGTTPLSLSPNPYSNGTLFLHTAWTGPAELRLVDAVGRLKWSSSVLLSGELALTVYHKLAAGLYVLSVAQEGRTGTVRLVVR